MVTCMECFRRFSQVILIITNIVVACLGLAVMIIGIWANVNGKNYIAITDNHSQFTQVSVLLIVIGLFVLIVGAVGAVGGIFASTVFGRIVLGLYAVVLSLLVVCEIAGGIAAAVKKNDLESVFTDSATTTFKQYSNSTDTSFRDAWDSFQQSFHCCGINGTDSYKILNVNNQTVPASCCTKDLDKDTCDSERQNPNSSELFQKGCVPAIIDGFKNNLGAIAGGAIVFGLFQIIGIVLACFVALYKPDNKYEVV